jgi:HEAT repeat protein
LRQCGAASAAALVAAYQEGDTATRRALVPILGSVAPAEAIPLFAEALSRSTGRERDEYRDAFSAAARRAPAREPVAQLLGDTSLPPRISLELLRLLGDDVESYGPAAGAALARVLQPGAAFAERYLALAPAARLSSRDAGALAFVRAALGDPDLRLRAEAARRAPALDSLVPALIAATNDPEVRVRAAAAGRLGELGVARAETALVQRLREDRWPLVRATAASALAHAGTAAGAERALVDGLGDSAPSVRRAALIALGARAAGTSANAVAERFQDDDEVASVRAAAARTLAVLCTTRWLDELTRSALWLREPGRPEPELELARASLWALGHLAPADLEQRLAPLLSAKVSPLLRPAIDAAMHDPERCKASPPGSLHPTR